MSKNLLVTLSLAALCFYPGWSKILAAGAMFYHSEIVYQPWIRLIAITLNILLLTLFLFPLTLIASRSTNTIGVVIARIGFLGVTLVPLNMVRNLLGLSLFSLSEKLNRLLLLGMALFILILVVLAFIRFGLRRITESTITLFLILSPCLLVFYGQAIWQAMKYENSKPLASPARGAQKNRIVWVIFDELDQHLAFVNRPPSLHLPEFDRLRGEALVATNAVAPADETLLSLPSLTIGRLVDKAEPISEDELAIRFHKSGETAHWSTQPTIFSQAREKGQNTAIIGWYLPYCRLFNRVTTKCYGDSARNMVDSRDERIIYNMLQLSASSLEAVPLVKRLSGMRLQSIPRGDAETVEGLILSYVGLLKESLSAVADPNLGLIFVHLSVPHPPTFFDREAGVFSSRKANSYLDGLALADRTLGDIRHAMEGAGVWDDTVVLISSDHPWRRNMWYGKKYYFNEEDESLIVSENQRRVPFILKLAGQSKAKVYESSFNTVLSKDLLLAIMQGEVANSESVVEWLETSKTRFAFDMAK